MIVEEVPMGVACQISRVTFPNHAVSRTRVDLLCGIREEYHLTRFEPYSNLDILYRDVDAVIEALQLLQAHPKKQFKDDDE